MPFHTKDEYTDLADKLDRTAADHNGMNSKDFGRLYALYLNARRDNPIRPKFTLEAFAYLFNISTNTLKYSWFPQWEKLLAAGEIK